MKLFLYLRIINYNVVMLPVDGNVKDTSGIRFFVHFFKFFWSLSNLPPSPLSKDTGNLSMIMKKDIFTHIFFIRDKLSPPQIIIVPHNNNTYT